MLLLLLLCGLLYRNGLNGPFLLDDGPQLVPLFKAHLSDGGWIGYLFSRSGPLGRPVAMATFLFNAATSVDDTTRWKLTNVMIHLACGLAVFVLASNLLATRKGTIGEPQWLKGAFIAGVWLLHPLQVSTVLYTVQRMTELAALFSFMALGAYLAGRRRQLVGRRGWPWIVLGAGVFFPLAVLSKETALLTPAFALLIEWLLLDFRIPSRGTGRNRLLLWLLLLPIIAGAAYFLVHFQRFVISGYAGRPFTLGERLLTEGRVIMLYLFELLVPIQANMGFVHDDIVVSHGWLQPPTTLVSALVILGLLLFAWSSRRKRPMLAFGIFFFFIGHLLESTVFPLELMFEHRNYLPSFGVFMALVNLAEQTTLRRPARAVLAVAVIGLLSGVTWLRVQTWSSEPRLYAYMYKVHPHSERIVSVVSSLLTDQKRYADAMTVLEPFHTPAAAFQRLKIECLQQGGLTPQDFSAASRALQGPLELNAVMQLVDLANLGLDHKCRVPPEPFRVLIDEALRRPIEDSTNRQLLLLYRAHYEWAERHREEAIATLDRCYAADRTNPIPLFLAAKWLIQMDDVDRARSYYKNAVETARRSRLGYGEYIRSVGAKLKQASVGAGADRREKTQ